MPFALGPIQLRYSASDLKGGGQRTARVLSKARTLKERNQPIPEDLGDLPARLPYDVHKPGEITFDDPVHLPRRKILAEPRTALDVGEQYPQVAESFATRTGRIESGDGGS
jgi:hypothetical protein